MLAGDDQCERALALAYRYLNRRERTEAEVRGHLAAKEIDAAGVERAIRTLREQGYLDDRRFAQVFVQDKCHLEQWGSQRIKRGLLARGVDLGIVETVLAEEPADDVAVLTHESDRDLAALAHDDDGELGRALALLRERFPSPPRDRRGRERALGVLLRKGYDSELAIEAVSGYARDPDAASEERG